VSKLPLVCDTSMLLYLGRINQINLIPALFEPVYVPEPVFWELDAGRTLRPDTTNPRSLGWATQVGVTTTELGRLPPNRLGDGERAVIAYSCAHPGCIVGLDDRQARLIAGQLNLTVVGTIGILIKARQAGLITEVRELLDAVQLQGLRIRGELYTEALKLAGE
jgi:predicted nucleic acid-binding protein